MEGCEELTTLSPGLNQFRAKNVFAVLLVMGFEFIFYEYRNTAKGMSF